VNQRLPEREDGFGLVELVIALAILNVLILALFATFDAGSLALRRANEVSTAETVADKQMERYRAHLYNSISLNATLVSAAAGDTVHTGDAAWGGVGAQHGSASCTVTLAECMPVQTGVTGADSRQYRVDTYVRLLPTGSADAPTGAREVKRVTVVVRRADSKVLARLSSTFDQATGCLGTTGAPC
jgi:type II secretory pathway component PulJ